VAEADEAADEEEEPVSEEDAEAIAAAAFESGELDLGADEFPTKKGKSLPAAKGKKGKHADEEEAEAEPEAEEDEDFLPKSKKGKKPSKYADEEELDAEEEEDFSPKSKKGKKGRKEESSDERAPAPARGGRLMPMLVGMILMVLLLGGGAAAGWYLAPNTVRDTWDQVAQESPNWTAPPKPAPVAKAPELTKLQKAHQLMSEAKYPDVVTLLKGASDPAELSTLGEAKWLHYFKTEKDKLDPKAAAVVEAKDELTKGKNDLLLAQIEQTFKAKELADELAEAADKLKDLDKTKTDKEKAEKLLTAAKQALVDGKVVEKIGDINDAKLPELLTELGVSKTALEKINKLLEGAKIEDKGDKGVKSALDLKQDSEDKLAAVNKELEAANIKDKKGADGVKEIAKLSTETAKDRDDLLKVVGDAFKELVDGKIVPNAEKPREQLVEGVKKARLQGESPLTIPLSQLAQSLGNIGSGAGNAVQQSVNLGKLVSELAYYRGREQFIQTPEQKLDTYISLLQDRRQKDADRLKEIGKEVDWVLSKEAKAAPESRGKALYVQGLALRNQEKFDEARDSFDKALKEIQPLGKVGPWSETAKKSQQELEDPSAYFLPRIDQMTAAKKYDDALKEANLALKAMPKSSLLHVQRGLVRYETIRGKGPRIDDEAQKAIRDDAVAAAADKDDMKIAARSAYLQGLLEEELHNLKKAEEHYREALGLARKLDPEKMRDEVGVYLDALGNVLLRDNTEPAPEVDAPKKKVEKVGARPVPQEHTTIIHPWSLMLVGATIGQVADKDDDPKNDPKLKEARKLAEELIASENKKLQGQGYLMLGQVLSKQGDRTAGLKAMAKGLELLFPGKGTAELIKMIEEHPAFQQPDPFAIPQPEMASRHFGEGMYFYWAGQYPQAESQFKMAIRYNNQDARYQYYYGLALWAQKTKSKRDAAIFAFEQGARLEAKNSPPPHAINLSLERVQGELRTTLNSYRYKALVPPVE
jgi:hypothetical protein